MNDPRVSDLMAAAGAKIGIKKHKVPPSINMPTPVLNVAVIKNTVC